jgi:uncharacterized protein
MTASLHDGRAVELGRDDARTRYTGTVDGRVAALVEYTPTPEFVVFTHTETEPGFGAQGAASQVVRWALDDVRSRGLRVVALCPFVKAYLARHGQEYDDLVYSSRTTDAND